MNALKKLRARRNTLKSHSRNWYATLDAHNCMKAYRLIKETK